MQTAEDFWLCEVGGGEKFGARGCQKAENFSLSSCLPAVERGFVGWLSARIHYQSKG